MKKSANYIIPKLARQRLRQAVLDSPNYRASIEAGIIRGTKKVVESGGGASGTYTSSDGLFIISFDE